MFRITSGKGFHVTFPNGYTVSVQWGPGNYCATRDDGALCSDDYAEHERRHGEAGSPTVETAVWARGGELLAMVHTADGWERWAPRGGDEYVGTVQGWQTPADVLALMNWAATQPAK